MKGSGDLRMINGKKDDDTFQGCFLLFFCVIMLVILSVTATGIYLALKNWG